jgi:hypothetical protein
MFRFGNKPIEEGQHIVFKCGTVKPKPWTRNQERFYHCADPNPNPNANPIPSPDPNPIPNPNPNPSSNPNPTPNPNAEPGALLPLALRGRLDG